MPRILRTKAKISPQEPAIMHQEWRNLLFLSWKCEQDVIQQTLPPGLHVDTYKGSAYLTIVPFKIQNLNILNMPSVPIFSEFIEVNLRTYVYDKNGIPGIWFYSLDINSIIAANAGREYFSLPYHHADLMMSSGKEIEVRGNRSEEKASEMVFKYLPQTKAIKAKTDALDFFLTERYALFSFNANQLYIQRIHHSPHPLTQCTLLQYKSHLFQLNSFTPPSTGPDHVCYSSGVDVNFFPVKKDPFFPKQS
jgi:uncharacterized protein YqjF (DUF2071 family)